MVHDGDVDAVRQPSQGGPGTARGRPRSPEADRAIAEATLGLLLEEGYEALTMAGVAQRAGVSTATLYRRYPGKVALVLGSIKSDDDDERLDTGDLARDLRALVGHIGEALRGAGGQLLAAMIGALQHNPDLARAMREQVIGPRMARLAERLGREADAGHIDPVPHPELLVEAIVGPLYFRALVTGRPIDDEAETELTRLVLRALGHRAAKTPVRPAHR